MPDTIMKKVAEIKIVDELYPRTKMDTKVIQQYASNLNVLPPIEINQDDILIDGAHRLSAYKQSKIDEIPCTIIPTKTERDLFLLAVDRNNAHGLQLSQEDKMRLAILFCGDLSEQEIIKRLSISERTYRDWTQDKRRQLKEDRDAKILDLWLQCWTLEDIARELEINSKQTVNNVLSDLSKNGDFAKIGQDFQPQIYNIWSFAKINNETTHYGNIPYEVVENLLYHYTQPFDVVFDPFGGGGVTIDVCKKWYRRYYVSDIAPTEIALQKGMRTHDITTGLPEGLPRPQLVFLDPPYWKQAKDKYTDKPTDFANMELSEFYEQFENLFKKLKPKISDNGYLAFIIRNSQWLNDDKRVEPHSHKLWNIAESVGFDFENIIHVPYSTQQYKPQAVICAQKHKLILELNRELIVFRKEKE